MKGNRRQWGKPAAAFALGATAGSAAALLLAPASGRVMRKKIGMQFRSLEKQAARQLNRTRKLLSNKAGHLKNAASERLDDTREWLVGRLGSNGRSHPVARRAARRS